MTVRAKFKINNVSTYGDGAARIDMAPVYDSNPESENAKFYNATPWGQITLGTVNKAAAEALPLGAEVYVDFTVVQPAAA